MLRKRIRKIQLAKKAKWVYHDAESLAIPVSEDTPMTMRIHLTRPTVKAMQERLQQAYDRADVRLVRRISALVEHLAQHTPISLLSERRDFGESTFYLWLHEFVLEGWTASSMATPAAVRLS